MSDSWCGCWCWNVSQTGFGRDKWYLPLVDLQTNTTILSSTSRTTLIQTYVNTTRKDVPEVQYTFPLYDGVCVVSFKCVIGSRTLLGVVKEKEQAKVDYDEAVARGEKAGLLTQMPEAADVFTCKVGNVSKDESVTVEVVYLGELKHDAESDSVRFTVPTRVAPRYGHLSMPSRDLIFGTNRLRASRGMRFLVEIVVEEGAVIRGVQSPSHPIAVKLGRNSLHDEDVFQNNLASATLATSRRPELDQDFVIMVNTKGQDTPRALIETHPTLENQRALMATLVPKFNLPSTHPEIVFIVDRSGSMDGKIGMVVQALKVFLKSIPVSAKFNICSFGSHHSFLFEKSRPYDQGSLEEAIIHLDSFSANYGGTELLNPIHDTFNRRLNGVPLEIMVLTDGQIFNQDAVFSYINGIAAQKVRVFSLGVGSGASTALVEGMARAGNGFAQFVNDGEHVDKRVIRMLKAALTPFISDYTIEIKYANDSFAETDDDYEVIESFTESMKDVVKDVEDAEKPSISLFDPDFREKQPNNPSAGKYDHLPVIASPKILQAPRTIPQLYAFNRTTVYLMLDPTTMQQRPQSIILKGTSEHGPLRLEIPVQDVGRGETIHQLAARKAVQDLEEGRGWVEAAQMPGADLLKVKYEADWSRIVEREAVRLGTKFQVGGKFCSFVAVETNSGKQEKANSTEMFHGTLGDAFVSQVKSQPPPYSQSDMIAMAWNSAYSITQQSTGHMENGIKRRYRNRMVKPKSPRTDRRRDHHSGDNCDPEPLSDTDLEIPLSSQLPIPSALAVGSLPSSHLFGAPVMPQPTSAQQQQMSAKPGAITQQPRHLRQRRKRISSDLDNDDRSLALPRPSVRMAVSGDLGKQAGSQSVVHQIIALQGFDGSWTKTDQLLKLIGLNAPQFELALAYVEVEAMKATALTIAWLEENASEDKDIWEMVADKARSWTASQAGFDDAATLMQTARSGIKNGSW